MCKEGVKGTGQKALSIFSVQLTILRSCCCPVGGVTQGEDRDIGEKVADEEVVQRWKNYKYMDGRTVWQFWRECGKPSG